MDFGSPEQISLSLESGPGSSSLREAATAWQGLASQLQSTAASYGSQISGLGGSWSGPSADSMVAAVTPYVQWLSDTGGQAQDAAAQATAAATAFETAYTSHVPLAAVQTNRTQLQSLISTNLLGQNTSAIIATETQYLQMWATNIEAMLTYAGSTASALQGMTPFRNPPQTTNASGSATQAANTAAVSGKSATNGVQSVLSQLGGLFQGKGTPVMNLLNNVATDYTNAFTNVLNGAVPGLGTEFPALINALKTPLSLTTQYNGIGLLINFPLSQFLKFASPISPPGVGVPLSALGGGLGMQGGNLGTLFSSASPVAASAGTAGSVGRLSVPTGWAAATPAVRTVAAALSNVAHEAVPATALGDGSLFSSMGLAGMGGSALGSGAPSAVAGANLRKKMVSLKDNRSPEKLKQLVAQISQQPEKVQHHSVDQAGLDDLLADLSKKPGVHAVHLSKGGKIVPSESKLG